MNMKGITIRFKGEAKVGWTERKAVRQSRYKANKDRETYRAAETYFDHEDRLFGDCLKEGFTNLELSVGRHSFPFRFRLPPKLPSSFEDDIGFVRYVVLCTIHKPWKFNRKTKRPFTIIHALDLNQYPAATQTLQAKKDKYICCWCCKSGPVQVSIHIERAGYVPGEAVKIYADINNGSNIFTDQSYVTLVMSKTYHATLKSKTETIELARVTRPSIPAHGRDVWYGVKLTIPSVPPSFLEGCKLIDIKYVLMFNVNMPGLCFNLQIPLNLIIGTVPLSRVVKTSSLLTLFSQSTFDKPCPTPTMLGIEKDALTDNQYLPPSLTYKESVIGPCDIREEDDDQYVQGVLQYAPFYTYYYWSHSTVV